MLGHKSLIGRCHLFNKLANYAIDVLAQHFPSEEVEESITFCRSDYVSPTDSRGEGFPDCIVLHENPTHRDKRFDWDNLAKEDTETNAFHWPETLVFVKFHTNEAIRRRQSGDLPKSRRDAVLQCISYALEMLSHTSLSTYALSMFITDGDDLELFHYNRYETVMTTHFNLLQNPSRFVALLYCLQYSTPGLLSFPLPFIRTTANGNTQYFPITLYSSDGACMNLTVNSNGGLSAKHGNPSNNQRVSFGRGTRVVHLLVVESADKHTWAEGEHPPKILRYRLLPSNITDPYTLRSAYLDTQGVKYKRKNRALQTLAMTELIPVTKLTTADALLPVIRDVFNCYRWAHEDAKIMHQDLSLYNIMYREEGGKIHGVIIDSCSSMSFKRQMLDPNSKRWAGTQAYMPLDLSQSSVRSMKHLYRHDLESLFYAIVFLTTGYDEGQEIENPPLRSWFYPGPNALMKKNIFFFYGPLPNATSEFKQLWILVRKLETIFRKGYRAQWEHVHARDLASVDQPIPEFDESTLGGHVDFDKFQEIISEPMCVESAI